MDGLALFLKTFGISPEAFLHLMFLVILGVFGVALFFVLITLASLAKSETNKASVNVKNKPKIVYTPYR